MARPNCNGDMLWHDDGNAFMCERCGFVVQRTRMNPMPDTTHKPKPGSTAQPPQEETP